MSADFNQEILQINSVSSNFMPPSEHDKMSNSQCFDTPKTKLTNSSPRVPSSSITFHPVSAESDIISGYGTNHALQPKLCSDISRQITPNHVRIKSSRY